MKNKTLGIIVIILIIIGLTVGSFILINNNKDSKNETYSSIKEDNNNKKNNKDVKKEEDTTNIVLSKDNYLKNGIYEVNKDYTLKIKDNNIKLNDILIHKNANNINSNVTIINDNLVLSLYNSKTKLNTLYVFNDKGKKLYSTSSINGYTIDSALDAVKYYKDYVLVTVSKIDTKVFNCKSKNKTNTIEVYKLILPTDNNFNNIKKERISKDKINRTDLCK